MKRFAVVLALVPVLLFSFGCADEGGQTGEGSDDSPCDEEHVVSVTVNGKTYDCDLDSMWEDEDSQIERLREAFEGRLNEHSSIYGHWLYLSDKRGTEIRPVRIGKDPYNFFPELPVMFFDNRGNLISLTSYDIDEGYFHYTFLYDEMDRILFSEEQSFFVPYKETGRVTDGLVIDIWWEYGEDGSFVKKTGGGDVGESGSPIVSQVEAYDPEGKLISREWYDGSRGEFVEVPVGSAG